MAKGKQTREELIYAGMAGLADTHGGDDAALRNGVLALLKQTHIEERAKIRAALESNKLKGAACAEALSALQDDILRALARFTENYVLRLANPTEAEKVTMLAVGGYGRGRLAPASDIDLLFLLPHKRNAASESFVEYMLYMLWDMGLKVGHATRSLADCLVQARADITIRTAMLESRCLWGSRKFYEHFKSEFDKKIIAKTAREFVAAKLAERDQRHERMGRSRYLVEPNVKEGKGGLRDLNTLFWIARYCYRIDDIDALVDFGVLTREEMRLFRKCDGFLWAVRCHLHFLTGRAEERLSFDVQKPLAECFATSASAGMKSVEKFMRQYFLVAKNVGDLTAIFCAALEEQQKKKRKRERLPALFQRQKHVHGFTIQAGRLTHARADCFRNKPVNLIRAFHLADRHRLDIHPYTLREIARNTSLLDADLRADDEANQLFLDILTSTREPERTLRRMNEAGVLGKFVPDFGKIVALMQFNMYHHYTADEHLLRAIGLLREIESGALAEEHRLAHELLSTGQVNRRVLYLATLLHDIAKGRPEDHSIAGARIARRLGPRLGFSAAETALTEWLVREHLVMSDVAQRRDLSDPKTIEDFAATVQTTERLKHLLVLTEVDIRAVGPGVWNGWKAQLLRELYYEAEASLTGAGGFINRQERVLAAQQSFAFELEEDWSDKKLTRYFDRHGETYWLSFPTEAHLRHARLIDKLDTQNMQIEVRRDKLRDCSEVTLICQDHAGLFARLTGACLVAGLDILDARITTSHDGLAVDTLHVRHHDRPGPLDATQTKKFKQVLKGVLDGSIIPPEHVGKTEMGKKMRAFDLDSQVRISNELSDTASVIEVSGLDRPGLLFALVRNLFAMNVTISAARVATFGERAVDAFYVQDLIGGQITHAGKRARIVNALVAAIDNPVAATRIQNSRVA